jgi:PEP-CTERM motif
MSKLRFAAVAASAAIALAAAPSTSWASFTETFTASGTVGGSNVGSEVTFTSNGSTLTIVLTETTAATGPAQLLDGLFFTITGANPTLGSAPLPTTAANKLFTDQSTSSAVDITGSWLLVEPVANGFAYGLSAVGGSGLFPANQFTLGGGGDDYGVAGTGTGLGANNFKNKFPLVENTVTFTLQGFSGIGISSVEFGYNSALSETLTGACTEGCGSEPQEVPVPEPATVAFFGLSLAGLGLLRRRSAA